MQHSISLAGSCVSMPAGCQLTRQVLRCLESGSTRIIRGLCLTAEALFNSNGQGPLCPRMDHAPSGSMFSLS